MRKERVVILTGPLQGQAVDIKRKLSIGRNPDNDLQLEDLQISRQHAVIEQNVDQEIKDDAMMLLAQCAEDQGNLDEARNALRNLLRRFPRSSLATDARRYLADLTRRALRGGVTEGLPPPPAT